VTPRRAAILVTAAAAWSFLFLGSRPLAEADESRYGEASREMIVRANPWYPTLGGRPHLTKPPLAYWMSASGMLILGQNEWGARAGLGVAFTAWIVAAYALGRRWGGDERSGIAAGVVLSTSLLPYASASLLTTDAFLSAAEGAAVVAAARALSEPEARRSAVRLMWLALGVAFLAKGPPGLLPLAGVALAWSARVDPRRGERWVDPVGAILFAAVGLSWYAAMILADPARFEMFVRGEVLERVFTNRFRREGPVWLPAASLFGGALPWTPFGIAALRHPPERPASAALLRLLLGWMAIGLVVFTLSRSRMTFYALPLVLGLAAPAGAFVAQRVFPRGGWRRIAIVLLATSMALVLLLFRVVPERFSDHVRSPKAVAAEASALRLSPEDPVLVLEARYPAGLAFYLRGPVVTTRMGLGDEVHAPQLDLSDVPAWVRERGGRAVAVGTEAAFAKLGPSVRLVTSRAVPRSRYTVGVLAAP